MTNKGADDSGKSLLVKVKKSLLRDGALLTLTKIAKYPFNKIKYKAFQKMGSFTDASSAKEFASVKTYMFLLLGVGVVNLLSAYKLLKNKVKN